MAVSNHRGAVCDRLASLLRGGWFAAISMVVEVGEEDDEGDSIADQSPLHPGGEGTASVEGVASMADCHVELDLKIINNIIKYLSKKKTHVEMQ